MLFYSSTNNPNCSSSVTPGPLQDVVIPAEVPKEVHMEVLSDNMAQLTEKMNTRVSVEEAPYVDIFTKVMNEEQKLPKGIDFKIILSFRNPCDLYHYTQQ